MVSSFDLSQSVRNFLLYDTKPRTTGLRKAIPRIVFMDFPLTESEVFVMLMPITTKIPVILRADRTIAGKLLISWKWLRRRSNYLAESWCGLLTYTSRIICMPHPPLFHSSDVLLGDQHWKHLRLKFYASFQQQIYFVRLQEER